MIVFIVSDSHSVGSNFAFMSKASARNEIIHRLKDYAAEFNHSDAALIDAISEIDRDFAAGYNVCGTCLGEYEVFCTETNLIED